MVRADIWRKKKYDAKIQADVIKTRFELYKDTMLEQVDTQFTNLPQFEDAVKIQILEPRGVPTWNIPFYLNYARELYRRMRKFSGKTLENEALILMDKWVSRGLKRDILIEIAKLMGVPITVYY